MKLIDEITDITRIGSILFALDLTGLIERCDGLLQPAEFEWLAVECLLSAIHVAFFTFTVSHCCHQKNCYGNVVKVY